MIYDVLFTNATAATMAGPGYGIIPFATIGVTGQTITYFGPADPNHTAPTVIDVDGALVTPALIDCHTHLVFGGDRISEFEQRLGGATYAELAQAGSGIMSTVRSTRQTEDAELLEQARRRVRQLVASGVGTIEIKSGYGLDHDTELRMLRVARQLEVEGVRIRTSLLAAHAVPTDQDADEYITDVCERTIPAAAEEGLADAVDAFGETIAFTPAQVGRVFEAAKQAGLPVRLHADQLSDQGGASLAARSEALSADHLEHASATGIQAMADAGTVAVVIPGASMFLNESTVPPIEAIRSSGCRLAVSTDLNPGTSPVASLQLAMWMACARFRITPLEALQGTTVHAAAALGLDDTGIIASGKRADLTIWDTNDPAALSYWAGRNLSRSVWVGGKPVTHD